MIASGLVALWGAGNPASGPGREVFEKRCTGCHSLDGVKVGPPLRGIFGRRAAAYGSFPYSAALQKSALTWNEATLERWLTDPESLVPDNDMAFRMSRAEERTAIIEYLKQLSEKPARPPSGAARGNR
ncbi:MAG: c-type cytochrome [Acidobacteria bacterium]|nr:c-type cytochrome [Acidobacteriota bacterium]